MDAETRRIVRERADDRCEYCRLRQEQAPLWRHQIEHIVPRKHRGTDDPDNLGLALRVTLRRPAANRPRASSEAAGGTDFCFTPGPRSANRSRG